MIVSLGFVVVNPAGEYVPSSFGESRNIHPTLRVTCFLLICRVQLSYRDDQLNCIPMVITVSMRVGAVAFVTGQCQLAHLKCSDSMRGKKSFGLRVILSLLPWKTPTWNLKPEEDRLSKLNAIRFHVGLFPGAPPVVQPKPSGPGRTSCQLRLGGRMMSEGGSHVR